MLRSAQMMMAQTVRMHYEGSSGEGGCGSGGVKHQSEGSRGSVVGGKGVEVERIACWFADFPNHFDINDDEEDEATDDVSNQQQQRRLLGYRYGDGGLHHYWYSLHQMVAAGLGLGVLPGEWYGPTTACHVLRELNEIHCGCRERVAEVLKRRRKGGDKGDIDEHNHVGDDSQSTCDVFRVHIATEGCIYLDAISKLMTSSNQSLQRESNDAPIQHNTDSAANVIDHPLSLPEEVFDPLRAQVTTQSSDKEQILNQQWDTSLLLLLPLRLGIQTIPTPTYGSTLAKLLSFPQSVGMLGGTPRHALWFYGADEVDPPTFGDDGKALNGQECGGWYGLDPHTTQVAPRGTRTTKYGKDEVSSDDIELNNCQWQVQLNDAYLRSLHFTPTTTHANHQRSIPLSKLDPSCALGFYIRDHSDFVQFTNAIDALSKEHCRPNKLPDIVTVTEKTPNYEVDVGSVMKTLMLCGKGTTKEREGGRGDESCNDDGGGGSDNQLDGFSMDSEEGVLSEEDDDDDYVLI